MCRFLYFLLPLNQWFVLIQRNFRVIFADKLNLALIILQVPLISMLIIVAFYNFERDNHNYDEAIRVLYYFDLMKSPFQQAKKSVNIDKLHRYAKVLAQQDNIILRHQYIQTTIKTFFDKKKVQLPNFALTDTKHTIISNIGSLRRGSVYFLLVAASIWFGIMGSCKEIVTEQALLKREIRSYLFIFPYLSAKFFVLTVILGIQTILLSIIVVPLLLELSFHYILYIWLILWVAAFVSASLGLFISSIVKSYRVALTLVPLLMIPQLLFGGLLRPQVDLENHIWSNVANSLSAITIQRWAFESILTTDAYAEGGILKLKFNLNSYNELNLVETKNTSLVRSFFKRRDFGNLWPPLFYLFIVSFVFFISAYLALRWRFS